jgi:tRNA pseudouridine55 synthase
VKYHGQRLYKLARAGVKVKPKSRLAKVYRLELINWQPPVVTIEVECGKGTYIRSLAHDLGQILGCGASLKSLTRLRYGLFDIKDAVSLPELEDAFRYVYWQNLVYPIDVVLMPWAAVVVSDETAQAIRNGQPWTPKSDRGNAAQSSYCRIYTADGSFLGVLHLNPESKQWQPVKVFPKLTYGN